MTTSLAAAIAALCLPGLCLPADLPGRPAKSPAEFFPPHTYLYVQLNPFSTVKGFQKLRLVKLLEDPTIRALFDAALKSIPPQSDPRKLLARYPFDRAIEESIAVGVVGFTARIRATDSSPARLYSFPKDGAVPSDLFRQRVQFQGRNLIAIKIADQQLFTRTLVQLLGDTVFRGNPPAPTNKSIDGAEVQVWEMPGVGNLFTAFVGGYFLVAQTAEDLIAATQRQAKRAASLSTRSDFSRFESHRGGKPTAGFLHLGIDSAVDLFSPLIPRAEREEIRKWGGFDYAGLQLGMGFHDGGICEWIHLAFAENPQGIFLNLSRLWPSTGFVETKTRRGTVFATSLTFDWAALYSATRFVLDLFDVDTGSFEREARATMGMDLREDLMGALGNTMGAVAVLPNLGIIPELSLVFKVRNRAKMEKVLGHVRAMCKGSGIPVKEFSVPGGGPKATYLNLGKDLPIKPAFALTGDKLVVSMMPLMLKYAIRKSRTTGLAVVDLMPGATAAKSEPLFSYSFDPAPMTRNVYADLLKILDSSGQRLPFEVTELPSPEFVADSLSQLGVSVSIDSYFMSMDLHSPTGIGIPLLIGTSIAAQMQQKPAPVRTDN